MLFAMSKAVFLWSIIHFIDIVVRNTIDLAYRVFVLRYQVINRARKLLFGRPHFIEKLEVIVRHQPPS